MHSYTIFSILYTSILQSLFLFILHIFFFTSSITSTQWGHEGGGAPGLKAPPRPLSLLSSFYFPIHVKRRIIFLPGALLV